MNKKELKPGIYSVGVVDWNLRSFHGYPIHKGTTYNAYLIIDDKIALIDTVKAEFAEELLDRIAEIVDPAKIDYVISNHVEMDHSGAIPEVMKVAKNAELITSSPNGLRGLISHYGEDYPFREVKAGDILNLGKRTLTFIGTPMLHWPDNMLTYCPEEKILFSNDAFGQHYTSNFIFDDEVDLGTALYDAQGYYANILLPFGPQVKKALAAVETIDIDIIAPSHGILWRSHIKEIVEKYKQFSHGDTEDTALIIYDTMWHSTEKMARVVAEGFDKMATKVLFYDLRVNELSDIMTEVVTARYLAVGCPTLDNNITPNIGAFLTYIKGLAPKGKKAFAFGSYGWSGQSTDIVNKALIDLGFEIIMDPIKIKYIPTKEDLNDLENKVASLKSHQ
ncbi:MAG TPA: FprA family A-type flavoprotein [Clostridiales bacterium]|nr:FprA family A-type flavoprotein [Clostridiales bacterium]